MFIVNDLGEQIMREIDASSRTFSVKAINLFPPGGFVGQLPQSAVAFDPVEAVSSTIPASGTSLITNLNRIRAGTALGDAIILQRHLSSGLIIPTETRLTVQGNGGVPEYTDIHTVRFIDSDITVIDTGLVSVDVQTPLIDFLLANTSGYVTRSWFMNGAIPSGVHNPAGVYQIPTNTVITQITVIAEETGADSLGVSMKSSTDGVTWTEIATIAHPASTTLADYVFDIPIPSGTFVGFDIVAAPDITTSLYKNVTVIMRTLEAGLGGSGGTLPTFTPRRIPFADNDTGLLTESARFNYRRDNNSDMLVVGADEYLHIGGDAEKVGIDIVRDGKDGGFVQEVYSDSTFAPSWAGFRARGTQIAPEQVILNDVVFRFTGRGYTSGGWSASPQFRIEARATEDYSPIANGTKVVIGITKNGETATTDAFQIDGDGLLVQENLVVNKTIVGQDLKIVNNAVSGYIMTCVDGFGNGLWLPTTSGTGGVADGPFITYASIPSLTLNAIRPELKNYNPNSTPVSPATYDDEFDDDSLDVKWTTAGHDASFDLYQSSGTKHLSESLRHGYVTFQGDWSFLGEDFFQTFAPADDNWSLIAKIHPGYNSSTNAMTSFGVIGAVSTDNYYQVRLGTAGDGTVGAEIFYNDGGGDTSAYIAKFNIDQGVYVMISKRYDGMNHIYTTFLSGDGLAWFPTTETTLTTMTTADLTYQYFGNYNAGTTNPLASIDFVRYYPDSGHFNIGANV